MSNTDALVNNTIISNTFVDVGIGKICKVCRQPAGLTVVFGLHKHSSKQGVGAFEKNICKSCEAEKARKYRQANPEKTSQNKKRYRDKNRGTIRYHVQEKISTWRKASNVASDLTVDYLVDLYNQQSGLCYYSGESMVFGWIDGKVNHNSLSLDRLDPSKGYIQGNVVWCTYLINTMKQNLTEHQFYKTINKIYLTRQGANMASIKEKLQRITTEAKLGDLPRLIEHACSEDAKDGKTSCRLYFYEPPKGKLPFFASLGPANQALWKEINRPFDKRISLTEEDFIKQVVADLEKETQLKIKFLDFPQPNASGPTQHAENISSYVHGASVVLDVSWE